MLFVTEKKAKFADSHVTDDVITLNVTWGDIVWQILSCFMIITFLIFYFYSKAHRLRFAPYAAT